ncbi:hypothetical protein M3Y94_00893300 [Aphelenchoides besseyi]|nr:hypothetical protein M3Y94_00893300 [Aphelenchoides besseyi]KAI6223423.1 hypothetical protein M3Y95_00888600 [Aphelenchoides besseyi]
MTVKEPTCLCGIGVHRAAGAIAVKSLIFALIGIGLLITQLCLLSREKNSNDQSVFFSAFYNLHRYFRYYSVLGILLGLTVVGAIASILLLYGQRNDLPALYWPFLFYSVVDLIVTVAIVVLWIISTFDVANGRGVGSITNRRTTIILMIVFTLLLSCVCALRTYLCVIVIFRAYTYLRDKNEQTDDEVNVIPIQPQPTFHPISQPPVVQSFFFLSVRTYKRQIYPRYYDELSI